LQRDLYILIFFLEFSIVQWEFELKLDFFKGGELCDVGKTMSK